MHSYSSPPYPSQFFLHVASWPSQAIRCVSGNHLHHDVNCTPLVVLKSLQTTVLLVLSAGQDYPLSLASKNSAIP